MQRFEIKHQLKIGDEVACAETKRVGELTRIWNRVEEKNNEIIVSFAYTVTPYKKSYNQFKVKEDNIRMVIEDVEGNEHFIKLPKPIENKCTCKEGSENCNFEL